MKWLITIILSFLTCVAYAYEGWVIAPGSAYYHYANKRQMDSQFMPTIRLGYQINNQYSAEILLSNIASDYKNRIKKYNVRGELYTFDLFHYFSYHALKPYFLGGFGLMHLRPHRLSDNDVEAHVDFGAGVSYYVSPKIHLSVDARDLYTFVGGKNDWMTNASVEFLFFK